ncbi:MAG: hypothetical protein HXY22_00150 [Alphaproteobacteria bacterium]|nr:hypothetical protein [Alphaproteobacteria bacterium]
MILTILRAGFAAILLGFAAMPASAETTAKDLEVFGKTVGFLDPGLSGTVSAAIVYDGTNAASKAEADAIAAAMGSGLTAGGVTLTPVLVDVSAISSIGSHKVAILTGGLSGQHAAIFAAASAAGVLTVSADDSCVRSGNCVMGVKSVPSVQILVNQAAAGKSSIGFKQAFRMMITEI